MSSTRPSLAIICNSVPPYRVHVHQRIARELPWLKLWTVCTHEGQDARWKYNPPAEIGPIDFGQPGDGSRHGLNLASFRKGGDIINWLRREQINAVLVLGYNDPGRLRIIQWCRRNGVPCFVWGDSNIKGDFASGVRLWVKKRLVGWVVDHVNGVFPCGSLGAAFFQRYGARPEQIYYFPNEPDYQQIWSLGEQQIAEVLAKHGLDPKRRRIVFSGRLIPDKGPDELVQAFVRFASERPDWDLLIVGDGPLRVAMEAAVPTDLRHRVQWTGFIDNQAEISALYRGSDVLALPSWYEPWALVLNEAVAAGMAIACSDVVGAAPELVRDGVNGFLFPPRDPQALQAALLKVTDNSRIDALKAASAGVLEDWRRRADPIAGLREALRQAGISAHQIA